mmetsp:Transcript_30147/g.56933  ORF Transcript_30147/g.56933 Transcript_30147/m.56933 type:complete len:91 (-) Transcript_30147:239-511(-)
MHALSWRLAVGGGISGGDDSDQQKRGAWRSNHLAMRALECLFASSFSSGPWKDPTTLLGIYHVSSSQRNQIIVGRRDDGKESTSIQSACQ